MKSNEPLCPAIEEYKPYIITVGRLSKPKGHWHLIRVFNKIKKDFNCKLLICGDGELKEYLKRLICSYDLVDDVILLGWVKNPFVLIKHSLFFVFSSLWEAMPMALLEAIACGVAVISTDCPYGPSEILMDSEFGILTPPLDGLFFKTNVELTPSENKL